MPKDIDDNYFYGTGTINEELEDFQLYEKNGELHIHDTRTDDVVRFDGNGELEVVKLRDRDTGNSYTPDDLAATDGEVGAPSDGSYVTLSDESDSLTNSQQHSNLTGSDLHSPAEHDNSAHSETYAVDGDTQPPETHDNSAHLETYAVDGDAQPPEPHDHSGDTLAHAAINSSLTGGVELTSFVGSNLSINASGELEATSGTDTRVDLTDGTTTVTDPTEATFTSSGSAGVTISDDGDGTATVDISATDNQRTDEEIEDVVAGLLAEGSNVTLDYDDANGVLTVSADGSTSDTRIDVANASGTVLSDPTEVTFTASGDAGVTVSDDGDGTATVDVSASGGSGESWVQTTVTSDHAANDYDSVWVDASSQAVTVTLPTPSQSVSVRVKAIDATNTVTVARNGSENIDGSASDLDLVEGESVELESDGTNWQTI